MMGGIPCRNCGKETSEATAKVFASVLVCDVCDEMATRLFTRCESELKRMLLLLQESIRVAIMEQRLQYSPADPTAEVPKEDLLRMIVQMTENKDGTAPRPPVR